MTIKLDKKAAAVLITILLVGASFWAGTKAGASGSTPGSVGDPLITQSYLKSCLEDFSAGAFSKLSVKKGTVVKCTAGTVIVLYLGSAKVSGEGDVIDISGGTRFEPGNTIAKYQTYLVPEKSGGITATADSVIFVMGEIER